MPVQHVQCPCFCVIVYSHCRNVIHMFVTGEGLLTQEDLLNSDGLQEVFATNLFGHFLLVHHRLHTYMVTKKSDVQQPTLICKKCNNKRRKYNKLIHHLKQKHPVY